MQERTEQQSQDWKRVVWIGVLVAASVAFSLGLACAIPLAAICAVGACTLPRRDAYYLAGAVWLTNQCIGFTFLRYPWTANTLAWGAALGLTALLCTFVARVTMLRLGEMNLLARDAIVFLMAFVAYEATLVAFSMLLGGLENFTAAIQGRIFALNAIALVGLFGLNWLGKAIGIASPTPATSRS